MSRIVIRNASILTLDDDDTFLYPATLVIENDRIVDMFEEGEKDPTSTSTIPTTTIDGTDKLIMPGLVDLHFHTSVAKGYNDTLPLWEYLDSVWYPSIRALTPASAHTAALHSYTTALKSGTTHVNDMYRHLPSLARAAARVGIRATLASDIALPEHGLDSISDNLAAHHAYHGDADGRVATVIVDGRIVVEGRKVLGVDEEQLRKDMDALFEHLVEEMEKQRSADTHELYIGRQFDYPSANKNGQFGNDDPQYSQY
ncbi:putative 5-methylthioadenosine s-adenosylhomocysteine deaminase n1 [Diplodia seriata]|uniref:Putative 5-methylthioadenosine s-adenosylhomocysteine deaminase n1 n=1 Tax=Diplodia seriata TaxID=420778 RepID=A0A0G2GX43_9PEZI|nr:putative 5-methylthioadenosine s-adenosylhomocysteine deaminase n1 [Diplodia seriata]